MKTKMKTFCFVCAFITYYQALGTLHPEEDVKRIVLHSEVDLAAEVVSLKNIVQAQAVEISDMKLQLKQAQSKAGYMSGTFLPNHHTGNGAGGNFLCLPDSPSWNHYTNTKDNSILITGVEYSFHPHLDSASQLAFFGSFLGTSEAPCAVCNVPRGTNIMIPGRSECFSGWTKEYTGYLVAGYPGYADSSEYVCLDSKPEVVAHSGDTDYENNLYFVEGHCGGTLACPPYVDGRELSCVVCSK